MNHQHPLDSLRGVLAALVLVVHAWSIFALPVYHASLTWVDTALGLAARGAVLAFFALSGYVIAASISANISSNGSFRADQFALARAFRVVPPLLVVILLTAALEATLRSVDAAAVTTKEAARSAFKTDPIGQIRALYTLATRGELTGAWLNGPLWSLTFEIRLYVISALVAVVLFGSNWLGKVAALVLLSSYASAIRFDPMAFGIDLQATSFVTFLCGVLAYRYRDGSTRALLAVGLLGLAAAIARASQARVPVTEGLDKDPVVLAAQVAMAIFLAVIVVIVGRGPAWNLMRRSGEYSYTLYIGHFPLFLAAYFGASRYAPSLLTPSLAIYTAAAMALFAWLLLSRLGRWIERPKQQRQAMQRWLDKLDASQRKVKLMAAVALLCLMMAVLWTRGSAMRPQLFQADGAEQEEPIE